LLVPGEYNRELDTSALQSMALDTLLAEGLDETSGTDAEDVLLARRRETLEKLAREQLTNQSLDDLQAQFQIALPDSKRTTLDEVAYTEELRRLLEAAQPVNDEQLLALAGERQQAIRTQLTSTENLPASQLKTGTPGSKGDAVKDNVQIRLEVETGSNDPAESATPGTGN